MDEIEIIYRQFPVFTDLTNLNLNFRKRIIVIDVSN